MKKTILAAITVATFLSMGTPAMADYLIPNPPTGQLFINKLVKNPANGVLQDNLNISETHILAGQDVFFRLIVTNTTGDTLNNVSVKDVFPNFIDFVTGPGSFDNNTRILSFNIDRLTPGEAKTFDVQGRVMSKEKLPGNQVTCLTNQVEARNNHLVSQDTASFCIESRILGVLTELPKTGISSTGLMLGLAGLFLLSSGLFYKLSKRTA